MSGMTEQDTARPEILPARVQSVDRALQMLELLASADAEGIRLSAIARALSLSRSAAWSTLQTLIAHDFVAQSEEKSGRGYVLGMSLARLGYRALSHVRLGDVGMPYLRSLTKATGLTSRLAVLQGQTAMVVGREDAPGTVRFNLHMGQPELLHSSSVGKALLAAMSDDEVRQLLNGVPFERRTSRTITTLDDLLKNLATIRSRGYSIDDEEDAEGIICIGACVYDHRDAPVGAISVTGLKQALPMWRLEEAARTVVEQATDLSMKLAGKHG